MTMKRRLSVAFACLICAASCGLPGSGPAAKVKEFVNLTAKRDSDSESKLKLMAKGEGDEATARERNRRILSGNVDLVVVVGEGVKTIDILKETVNGKSATVETSILGVTNPKPFVFRFQLQNESSGWKIVEWRLVDNSR